jgi:hypothetical protein
VSNLHIEKQDQIEFTLPFKADGDRVVDSEGREVCSVSMLCSAEEAIRIAKLFAASYQAFTMLSGVKSFIYASTKHLPDFKHGQEGEDKSACILCAIDEFTESVFAEPKKPSTIIS